MKLLEAKIRKDAILREGNIIQIDNFLNHQIDIAFLQEIAKEIKKRTPFENITKIVTIEASGIAIAAITAQYFDNIPVVFAKKAALNQDSDCYHANITSYTKKVTYQATIAKRFLTKDDNILIIDDFMAQGEAMKGLLSLVEQSGATFIKAYAIVEKGFQNGGAYFRDSGINYEALAIIDSIDGNEITFR